MISSIAIAVGAFGCDCSAPPPPPPPPVYAPAPVYAPDTMTVNDSYRGSFDISPPTVLSVLLDTPSNIPAATRCADMGATLDITPSGDICRGVDY